MKTMVIFGSGGIGVAVAKSALQSGQEVIMVTRKTSIDLSGVQLFSMDVTEQGCVDQLSEMLKTKVPDTIINTIGMLHDEQHLPEKNIRQLEFNWLMQSMKVNVMPTIYIAQALSNVMNRQSELKFLSISARVSSIADNRLGGWYSYRMSKAALNMLIKNIAIEWSHQFPEAAIFAYHPGTVDTSLSRPFHANIPADKLFSTTQAADYLVTVLEMLTKEQSGGFFDWQGLSIEY